MYNIYYNTHHFIDLRTSVFACRSCIAFFDLSSVPKLIYGQLYRIMRWQKRKSRKTHRHTHIHIVHAGLGKHVSFVTAQDIARVGRHGAV